MTHHDFTVGVETCQDDAIFYPGSVQPLPVAVAELYAPATGRFVLFSFVDIIISLILVIVNINITNFCENILDLSRESDTI